MLNFSAAACAVYITTLSASHTGNERELNFSQRSYSDRSPAKEFPVLLSQTARTSDFISAEKRSISHRHVDTLNMYSSIARLFLLELFIRTLVVIGEFLLIQSVSK